MSEKVKLRQKLAEKEEDIRIREHDFEQAHLKLKVLSKYWRIQFMIH
jgi:hypothetical protein